VFAILTFKNGVINTFLKPLKKASKRPVYQQPEAAITKNIKIQDKVRMTNP
jgi:hypothetical protein